MTLARQAANRTCVFSSMGISNTCDATTVKDRFGISSIATRGKLGKEIVRLAGGLASYETVQAGILLAKEVKRDAKPCGAEKTLF